MQALRSVSLKISVADNLKAGSAAETPAVGLTLKLGSVQVRTRLFRWQNSNESPCRGLEPAAARFVADSQLPTADSRLYSVAIFQPLSVRIRLTEARVGAAW